MAIAALAALLLAGCSRPARSVLGAWRETDDDLRFTFSNDGSGTITQVSGSDQVPGSTEDRFTWSESAGELHLTYRSEKVITQSPKLRSKLEADWRRTMMGVTESLPESWSGPDTLVLDKGTPREMVLQR